MERTLDEKSIGKMAPNEQEITCMKLMAREPTKRIVIGFILAANMVTRMKV